MHTISIQIVRFTDPSFPGWVECILRDASGCEWKLTGKVPVFTKAPLDAASSYPQPGVVACEIIREWIDEHSRKRCSITTERPWGIEAEGGVTQFEVFRDQIGTQES